MALQGLVFSLDLPTASGAHPQGARWRPMAKRGRGTACGTGWGARVPSCSVGWFAPREPWGSKTPSGAAVLRLCPRTELDVYQFPAYTGRFARAGDIREDTG